jgi:two-component system, NarL family, response regulator NreC
MSGRPLRVLIADDHTIVRQGLASILHGTTDITVVAEAANGYEAVEKAIELRPDVVVLDISMPRLNGLEAARRITRKLPDCRVLVLTMHEAEEYVLRMVRAGVSGYLVKDEAASELITAIRAVSTGKGYFGPNASRILADAIQVGAPAPDDPYGSLTDREREIFQLVVEGRTSAQIATTLCISPKTVENHRTHIMEKLSLHSVAELLRYAARHGLLS